MTDRSEPRRYLTVIQDPRGYPPPGAPLEPAPPEGPEGPVLMSVVSEIDYDDIRAEVERLRAFAESAAAAFHDLDYETGYLHAKAVLAGAADKEPSPAEWDRLVAALHLAGRAQDEADRLRAEVERLRETLADVINHWVLSDAPEQAVIDRAVEALDLSDASDEQEAHRG